MKYETCLIVGEREVSASQPTYFIADIASNHDGEIERARDLVWIAKEAGADAAKFQHFKANQLVSDAGFKNLSTTAGHQDRWKKSVFKVYEENEYRREWDAQLHQECLKADIHFMTSPYDISAVDSVEPFVTAYKIGSGDITTPEMLEHISSKSQPIFLASGASSLEDVKRAVKTILKKSPRLALMQCNTNYTGSVENFHHINLNVLNTFAEIWPKMVLGLSDHTPGHATVLAAVTLGARCVEKHFTDNKERNGPDHPFSMDPTSWKEMVNRTREVEQALGDGIKRIQDNERETAIVQRRGLYLKRRMAAGEMITEADLMSLRPASPEVFFPYEREQIFGQKLLHSKEEGDPLYRSDILIGT